MLIYVGVVVFSLSFTLALIIGYPVLNEELKYRFTQQKNSETQTVSLTKSNDKRVINPVDNDFGVVVPKIGANAKVIKDVDPFNAHTYQQALTQGVAHAKGSPVPDEFGNTFLFAHSSDNFYNANRYNSVFYLLSKLESDDIFYLTFDNQLYKYSGFRQINCTARGNSLSKLY